jgi:inosine-uridine nucleoside N-ribohydrolase
MNVMQKLRTAGRLMLWLITAVPFVSVTEAFAENVVIPVVVDTDVSLDDARALALLAASTSLSLRAIVTSDGGSTPCDGARRATALLALVGRPRIPIGAGRESAAMPPPWRPVTAALDAILSGLPQDCHAIPPALEVARRALAESPSPVVWLALGPLTNLAALLRADAAARERIARVDYAGGNALTGSTDWNTDRDPEAAAAVFAAGIPIRILAPLNRRTLLRVDDALLRELHNADSPAGRFITRLHTHAMVRRHIGDGSAPATDDMAALALVRSSAFRESLPPGANGVRHIEALSTAEVRAAWLDVARSTTTVTPALRAKESNPIPNR